MRNLVYPELGKKIDAFDSKKNTTVVIIAPTDYIEELYSYSSNFYKAAHWLAEYLLNNNRNIAELDTYIFPLTFLYRHSLELLLKSIGLKLVEDKKQYLKKTFHNLHLLLDSVGSKDCNWAESEEYKWVLKFLVDITKLDKESDSFRYPFHIFKEKDELGIGSSYGIKRIFERQTHIDLWKLSNKFEIAYGIIDAYRQQVCLTEKVWREFTPIFIEEGGEYYAQSVVGYEYSRYDFYPYTNAYLNVANQMKKFMNKKLAIKSTSEKNIFFFPMCYLYRNGIELAMKAILFEESGENFQTRCKILKKKKHSIKALWGVVRQYAEKCSGTADISYLNTIDEYVEQIQGIDSDASKFRYPVNKNLQLYFEQNKRFDFNIIGDFMEALINFCDGVDAALNNMNEIEAEIQAEYMSEMRAEYYSDMYDLNW